MGVEIHRDKEDWHSHWIDFRSVDFSDAYPAIISSAGLRQMQKKRSYIHSNADMGEGGAVPYHILQYTVSGQGEITYFVEGERKTYKQTAGKCFFITRDVRYKFGKSSNDEWECIYIGFRGELAEHVFKWIFEHGFVHDFAAGSDSVTGIQQFLNRALRYPMTEWDIKKTACNLLLAIQKDIADSNATEKDRFIQDAENWVNHNISSCNVITMAEHYGYSAKYFQSFFREKTGMPPGAFIKVRRINFAEHLIACSGMKLAAIAEMAGFSDASHLCRQFRKLHGITPEKYRNINSTETAQGHF